LKKLSAEQRKQLFQNAIAMFAMHGAWMRNHDVVVLGGPTDYDLLRDAFLYSRELKGAKAKNV